MSRAERRRSKREKKRQAGESARKAQQLAELALAREELQGRSAAEWLNLFNEHQGTPEACPGGHPELAFASATFGADSMRKDHVCPACGVGETGRRAIENRQGE